MMCSALALGLLLGLRLVPEEHDAELPRTLALFDGLPRPERPLPRSIAEDYEEDDAEDPEAAPAPSEAAQEGQDPQETPRPRKEDLVPQPGPRLPEPPHASFLGFFRTHFSSQAWEENVYRDYLQSSSVLLPLSFGAAAGLVSPWDKPLQARIEGTLNHQEWIGNLSMYSLVGTSVLLAVLNPGEGRNPWDELWEQGEAYAVSGLLTALLKMTVGRSRPHGGSKSSFPSGHAATAFTAAALIQENSGWTYGAPAYGMAGLTGYSRIEAGRHYPSDVLAGAAIGILTVGVLDALHWGNRGPAHGIAGRGPQLELEIDPGSEKRFSVGVAFGF